MQIHFYRANEPYGFLSNHAHSPFVLDGRTWPTVEHYYQAMKFADVARQEAVRAEPKPMQAKRLAWSFPEGTPPDWKQRRDSVMLAALHAKFGQNPDLAGKLLATADATLVEHTSNDAYWGDGGDGTGASRLGDLLAQVRGELAAMARPSVNRALLEWLFATGRIDLRRGALFDSAPRAHAAPVAWDRVEGMCLGLAIGDALGNTSEGNPPDMRRQLKGEIRDYLPNRYAEGRAVGLPSDDTQLAFLPLAQINEDRGLVPDHLAQRLCSRQIFGIGSTIHEFLIRYVSEGAPWYDAGSASAGNGALLRSAPLVIPHLCRPSSALWGDTAMAAMVTHNDCASIASCLALVGMLWDLLGMQQPPEPQWWLDRFIQIARPLETGRLYRPRSPFVMPLDLPFSDWIEALLGEALQSWPPTLAACNRWYSAAFLLETVPSTLYILMRYADDPEQAILRAVNETWDNDTCAAIVGAAVGALHGKEALPRRWRDGLLGRLGADDDGALFDVLEETRRIWFPA